MSVEKDEARLRLVGAHLENAEAWGLPYKQIIALHAERDKLIARIDKIHVNRTKIKAMEVAQPKTETRFPRWIMMVTMPSVVLFWIWITIKILKEIFYQ